MERSTNFYGWIRWINYFYDHFPCRNIVCLPGGISHDNIPLNHYKIPLNHYKSHWIPFIFIDDPHRAWPPAWPSAPPHWALWPRAALPAPRRRRRPRLGAKKWAKNSAKNGQRSGFTDGNRWKLGNSCDFFAGISELSRTLAIWNGKSQCL